MQVNFHHHKNQKAAEVLSDEIVINKVQDALDLMADIDYQGSRMIIVHEKNITPDFFNLRTGIAGEILQKFVNYKVKLAIVGDFSKYTSSSLKSFIIECNRGNQLFFLNSVNKAKEKLFE